MNERTDEQSRSNMPSRLFKVIDVKKLERQSMDWQ